MRIVEFVLPELLIRQLKSEAKARIVRELAEHVAAHVANVDREALTRVLMERERLASTAIGEGVAIPHGKLEGVGKLVACLGRSTKGVDFESMDGRPTHLFFTLVAP